MNMKLFVGNLPWKITGPELKSLFEAYGEVLSAKIISDQYTGKSKGFGFIEMANSDEAKKAVDELNGKTYLDRPLRVSEAQERKDKRERSDRGDYQRSSMGGSGNGRSFRFTLFKRF